MEHPEELQGLSLCKASLQKSSPVPRSILGRRGQLFSLWHLQRTQPWSSSDFRATRVISEPHKRLAQRFVYGELKIKFDFKIAQSPVPAQRVTFFFHLCLLPALPSSFPRLACKHGRIFPKRVAGRNLWLGN